MRLGIRLTLWMGIALAALGGESRAQWGYGYYPYGYGGYGWGGWSSTFQGDVARGLGVFNMGAGIYNRETAIARSINVDTLMRYNQYVYESQLEANRRHHALLDANLAKDRKAYEELITRIQDSPSERDIENGDALNAVVDQLSDPRIHSSALRMASDQLDARLIQEVPFRNAAEAVTFSLGELKRSSHWPSVLLGERFAPEREEFLNLIEETRTDSLDGEIEPERLARIRDVVNRLKQKIMAMPLEDNQDNQEALKFTKTITALTRMLEKPDIERVIGELKKIEKTTTGNLLGFMHTFNLRFAPARTPAQRQAYLRLYPILDKTRGRILGEAKIDESATTRAEKGKLNDFFSGMDLNHIEGKKASQPADPSTPKQP